MAHTFEEKLLVADVLLPTNVAGTFTYLVPAKFADGISVGRRVQVSFGQKQLLAGVVVKVYPLDPKQSAKLKLKPILELLDQGVIVTPRLLEVYRWIAEYYMTTEGEVLKASLPPGLKIKSEQTVEAVVDVNLEGIDLGDSESMLLEALGISGTMTLEEVNNLLSEVKNPKAVLKKMQEKGLIRFNLQPTPKAKAQTRRYLKVLPAFAEGDGLKQALASLQAAPKQLHTFLILLQECKSSGLVLEKELLSKATGSGSATTRALVDRGFVEMVLLTPEAAARAVWQPVPRPYELTPLQSATLTQIRQHLACPRPQPILLHGVTGSGKTLIYIELIKETIAAGKQAIYLLPEIGLTRQIIDRVSNEIGEQVGVYHSRFNNHERVDCWQKVLDGTYRVLVGVRSAILLPYKNPGLIIVDEEHDPSFKQQDPAPRYNAREVALWYGAQYGIPVILGSATPSLESFYNSLIGKYKRFVLGERAVAVNMPELQFVDMKTQITNRQSHGLFSDILIAALNERLEKKEQSVIFNNRRGYAPYMLCTHCGEVPHCLYCDVSLTYHKKENVLRCHYCGYVLTQTARCNSCGALELRQQGVANERIEEQLALLFPNARIARMDLDTTRGKDSFNTLMTQFEHQHIDILVGTQMITKGLDFPNVTLAAVVDADRILNYPDFRAYEYGYQLLTQFSGRAGRNVKPGKVIIQTRNPEHPVLALLTAPYSEFYDNEIQRRLEPGYPPFTRLMRIELQHKDPLILQAQAQAINQLLKPTLNQYILGPEFPPVARVKNLYRVHFLAKSPRETSFYGLKLFIRNQIDNYLTENTVKGLNVLYDVDPR